MAYTTSEARQELLDAVARAANELGLASALLAEAYEQLDEDSGDRLEEHCFRPCHSEGVGTAAAGQRKGAASDSLSAKGLEPLRQVGGSLRVCGRGY